MKRIVLTPQQPAQALLIWIRVAPSYIWRKSEAYERLKREKRHDPQDAPDPHRELADYLAGRFDGAKWEITHPEAKNHG